MQLNSVQFNCDLSEIIEELQGELHKQNINLLNKTRELPQHIQVQCPYHKHGHERKPSAGIRKDNGVFHCFTCGQVATLPEMISHCFGYDNEKLVGKFGWKWLLKNFATVEVEERKEIVLDFGRDSKNSNSNKLVVCNPDSDSIITDEEMNKYRFTHPYMYRRRLTDEIIEIFDLGYDASAKDIIFPIKDIKGNILYLARRNIRVKRYNYPYGAIKPLYGLYEIYHESGYYKTRKGFPDEVIVCEGMFDALTCWVYGKYAVALNGLGSRLQIEQLKLMPCRKIILALDNDKRGRKAAQKLKEKLKDKIVTEYIIPDGKKDINELDAIEFDAMKEVL